MVGCGVLVMLVNMALLYNFVCVLPWLQLPQHRPPPPLLAGSFATYRNNQLLKMRAIRRKGLGDGCERNPLCVTL